MPILESDDNHLRKLIFDEEKVIVKFTDEDCAICKALSPSFEKLAHDPNFTGIAFVRMNAKENPVSSKEVSMTGTPFFATFRKGTLLDCGIVSTEDGIRKMLLNLKKEPAV